MQPRWIVAAVFLVEIIHVPWRDMSLDQLLRRETAPRGDVLAVTAFDAKGALDRAHDRTDALLRGIGQVDARRKRLVRAGHATNAVGRPSMLQTLVETAIT